MKRFLLSLAVASLAVCGIQAQEPQNVPATKTIAPPSADDKLISEAPKGTFTTYVKEGLGYGYNQYAGMLNRELDDIVSNVVISDDGKKIYIQNPIYYCVPARPNWIEGDIENGEVTFTFPQLVGKTIENGKTYLDYAMCFDYNATTEWYYPSDQQTYKFKLEADGSLTSLEKYELMIGQALWLTPANQTAGWYWQGNGEFLEGMKPVNAKVAELPENIEMKEWQLFTTISARPVEVGVDGDKMYISGLFNSPGMEKNPVVGTIDGNKVVFASHQYMGVYAAGLTTTYFQGGIVGDDEEKTFNIADNITFNYDKEKNILSTDQDYCISLLPNDAKRTYAVCEKPYIAIPEKEFTVTSIPAPEYFVFQADSDESDWDAEFYFYMPTIDSDHNLLDTSKLYYEVFVNNQVYTFYDDEYELPEGMSEMTLVPYGYETEDRDFRASDNIAGFVLHARGFDSLGVRAVYKADADRTVYSAMLWAPGYVVVKNIEDAQKEVKSEMYYNLCGSRVERPANGIFLKVTKYADGTTKANKVIVK